MRASVQHLKVLQVTPALRKSACSSITAGEIRVIPSGHLPKKKEQARGADVKCKLTPDGPHEEQDAVQEQNTDC